MFADDDLLWMDELPEDEPAELLTTMPEIRRSVAWSRCDDEVGLRALLEQPEALSKAWRKQVTPPRYRASESSDGRRRTTRTQRTVKKIHRNLPVLSAA